MAMTPNMTTDSAYPRGIGNDIIEIKRMRRSIERHGLHFLNRLFTQREQDYCYKYQDPVPHFAGHFSAKEAIVKALGTGFGSNVQWHEIEIINDDLGKPVAHFSESLKNRFNRLTILISISHCNEYATAVALWL